jgi:Secretion system C-terminal sorting domain
MKISNLNITVLIWLNFLLMLSYGQETSTIENEYQTTNYDTLEVMVDSLDIVRSDGSLERQIYQYDLSTGKFTELYKLKDSEGWKNDWRHVFNYGTDKKIESRCGDNWKDSIWVPSWCYQYDYDVEGNIISETLTNYQFNSSSWIYIKRSLNTYNTSNQKIMRLDQIRNGTNWVNKWQAEYGYDEYGNRNYLMSGDYVANSWIQQHRTNMIFNGNSKRLLYQSEIKSGNDSWTFDIRIVSTYNKNGNIISVSRDKWENEDWINEIYYSYTYNESELILRELVGYYADSTWNNIYRTSYEYNSIGKKSFELIEQWDTTTWNNNSRTTFEYDNNENLVNLVRENHFSGYWELGFREFYEYKENQLDNVSYEYYYNGSWILREGFYEFYGSPGIKFYIQGAKINFYYNNATHINIDNYLNSDYNISQNYPNPFNPSTKIQYTLPQSGVTRIYLFDILGREILKLVDEFKEAGNYEIEFNAEHLSNGIYFYKINSGNYSKTKKMVLLK